MRYYSVAITGGKGPPITFTSFINGQTDFGALDIELDISTAQFSLPSGKVPSFLQIYGISQSTIAQSSDFNGRDIVIQAGMQAGLPLANPKQAGQLISGTILQAFGNWVGVEQTLSLYLGPPVGSNQTPQNLILNWRAGMTLVDAVKNCLMTAYPAYTFTSLVTKGIVQPHDEIGVHYTVSELARTIKDLSADVVGGGYTGVELILSGTKFTLFDGTSAATPRLIAFNDLIGQPTWQAPGQIQVITVMRADISAGDVIQLPKTPITNTASNLSQYADRSSFQGKFRVGSVRHIGRYRQPDATAWVSIFDCYGTGSIT